LAGYAQTAPQGVLSGTVVDPSDAAIPQAVVELQGQEPQRMVTDAHGQFRVRLSEGAYALRVEAQGFRAYSRTGIKIAAGHATALTIKLEIATANEEVNVPIDSGLSTDADSNKSAIVFKGDKLDTLSDDPAMMQQQLQAVAGTDPSNPPQIYVDGFSNGAIPPKDSIREIRINQNPFSAQYDQFGMGRIEVFTKPGSDKLHGSFAGNFGNNVLNARNPYVRQTPPYTNSYETGDVDGPLGKKSSFFFSGQYSGLSENAIVNATTLDSGLNQVKVSESVPNQRIWQSYSLRLDRQVGAKDTLTGRYTFEDTTEPNLGVGLLVLPSEGAANALLVQTLQLTESHIFNAHVVLDQGLQYIRTRQRESPASRLPSIVVQGAFSGGGSPTQSLDDNLDQLELQEYFSISEGKHFIRTGVRYRANRDANTATASSNGQYIFPDIETYQRARMDVQAGLTGPEIAAKGDGPTQFSISAGRFNASIYTGDVGVYAEDEWKATQNLTLNYGLRLESQSAVPDHLDVAPRLGLAYAVKPGKRKAPVAVLRAGFGMFYHRFASSDLLTTVRQNGVTERVYYVPDPQFYAGDTSLPDVSQLAATQPTVYRLAPNLRSPISAQGLLGLDHSFGKYGSISANLFLRKVTHQWTSLNVNAPLPGTEVRPMGGDQNVYQYSSDGVITSHLVGVNGTVNAGKRLTAWAFAGAGHVQADAFGQESFPTDSYDLKKDMGPYPGFAPRVFFWGADAHPGWDTEINLFMGARAHSYFNITTGQDNNGDSIYNDRPAFATDLTRSSVVRTKYGNFDTDPIQGQTIIPMNYGDAPGMVFLSMRAFKNFHFGPREAAPKPPPGAKAPAGGKVPPAQGRYRLQVGIWADNVLNHVNPGPPIGVLTSPEFGKSISLGGFTENTAANRALTLHAAFFF
jgi:hypothetical protein